MVSCLPRQILAYILLLFGYYYVHGDGNIGCLFKSSLCKDGELCFQDNAFGRCWTPSASESEEEGGNYKYDLSTKSLRLLETEMQRLIAGGYRWTSGYTQCVVKNILFAERYNLDYDPGTCSRLLQMTLPYTSPEVIDALIHDVRPDDLAFIKFKPNHKGKKTKFADESFKPPAKEEEQSNPSAKEIMSPSEIGKVTHFGIPGSQKKPKYIVEDEKEAERLSKAQMERQQSREQNRIEKKNGENAIWDDNPQYWPVLNYLLMISKDTDGLLDGDVGEDDEYPQDTLPVVTDLSSDLNNYPAFMEGGVEWMPIDQRENTGFESLTQQEQEDQLLRKILESLSSESQKEKKSGWSDFVEPVPEDIDPEVWKKMVQNIQEDSDNPFMRNHRYDIRKPGPTFYLHERSAAGNTQDDVDEMLDRFLSYEQEQQNSHDYLDQDPDMNYDLPAELEDPPYQSWMNNPELMDDYLKDQEQVDLLLDAETMETDPFDRARGGESPSRMKLKNAKSEPDDKRSYVNYQKGELEHSHEAGIEESAKVGGHYETVDSSHTYIMVEEDLTEATGKQLVAHLERLLSLPRGTFSNIRVEKNLVDFKVNPNPQKLNASAVAAEAETRSASLKRQSGFTVAAAGIGDKVKLPIVVSKESKQSLFVLTFVLCGCIVGILVAVGVIFLVKRNAKSKEKLQALGHPDTEASLDYQDLCRQRMARKNNEKPEPIHSPKNGCNPSSTPPKVGTAEFKESQSSRSSTSSWNEEPATSNMDISTGHMILSYMEDHLKNKDRLDREWEALCAYEAEPCGTSAATLSANIKKNRYPDVLPYDHCRVLLTDSANICGSDYINATTITDHDPRNPAYIATQGPLPHTAADFWQMVWEQGSVVIVMLTRLMENGVAMCHRYWPEEGSELYHIYEVHLVSEHVWCDDYLVRSFYLKNLKTSETRTVTQFHFLSWPDNGIPSSAKALLEFRRKVNKSYRGRSCPIAVHCSDGIGRTGTYCLIDMVLNRMAKGVKEIDIAATLEHIRDQRGGMVKTKAQFEFVLMAIAEEVHAILKALAH